MKKIYISHYQNTDSKYYEKLLAVNYEFGNSLFENVNSPGIEKESYSRTRQNFIELIKNKYVKNAEVLVVLVGLETKKRKQVDWEVRAALTKTNLFDKCGVVIVYLDDVVKEYKYKIPRSILPNILNKNFNQSGVFLLETTWDQLMKSTTALEKYLNVAYAYGKMSNYILDDEIKETDDSNVF